jgi:hypothetical protein
LPASHKTDLVEYTAKIHLYSGALTGAPVAAYLRKKRFWGTALGMYSISVLPLSCTYRQLSGGETRFLLLPGHRILTLSKYYRILQLLVNNYFL